MALQSSARTQLGPAMSTSALYHGHDTNGWTRMSLMVMSKHAREACVHRLAGSAGTIHTHSFGEGRNDTRTACQLHCPDHSAFYELFSSVPLQRTTRQQRSLLHVFPPGPPTWARLVRCLSLRIALGGSIPQSRNEPMARRRRKIQR